MVFLFVEVCVEGGCHILIPKCLGEKSAGLGFFCGDPEAERVWQLLECHYGNTDQSTTMGAILNRKDRESDTERRKVGELCWGTGGGLEGWG